MEKRGNRHVDGERDGWERAAQAQRSWEWRRRAVPRSPPTGFHSTESQGLIPLTLFTISQAFRYVRNRTQVKKTSPNILLFAVVNHLKCLGATPASNSQPGHSLKARHDVGDSDGR
jgi:uncharacterized membrane protein